MEDNFLDEENYLLMRIQQMETEKAMNEGSIAAVNEEFDTPLYRRPVKYYFGSISEKELEVEGTMVADQEEEEEDDLTQKHID